MNRTIALAGNPNVGKSTVFNALTGMHQHTGNWPGKTVESAKGECTRGNTTYHLVDLPGCYSLLAHSEEEEIARDFICFEHPETVVVVCDATCLERNLNLVLQIMEITNNVILCVNLLDEAKKKKIKVHLDTLSELLAIPVIGTAARSGKGLESIFKAMKQLDLDQLHPIALNLYPEVIQQAVQKLKPFLITHKKEGMNAEWLSVRLLENTPDFMKALKKHHIFDDEDLPLIEAQVKKIQAELMEKGYDEISIQDVIAESFISKAEQVSKQSIVYQDSEYAQRDRKLDWFFTSKTTGFLVMFLLLLAIFWITITGANVPSTMLADSLFWVQDRLVEGAVALHISQAIYSPLIFGVYRVVAWVISVMLPPMAIFFPLFTLLEDFGYLPRIAYNLDRCFKKCSACGKQALTMCMGFGCNAAGVVGCRIIDSPRERLIAIITNNFVPCNGRFPTIIAVISMFLIGSGAGFYSSFLSAFLLTLVIILGVIMTLFVSKLLSKTLLKGFPSSFTLELPPYRRPLLGRVIVRSIFDRTLFVLARAIIVAAPAGIIIYVLANIMIKDTSLLTMCAGFLDPFGRLLGLDGVILMAFILGMPANEIVIPVMLMTYLAQSSLSDLEDMNIIKVLLIDNGWTWITAVSTILFSLMHWPCGTTLLTIKKETQSIKWMMVSFLVPTIMGVISCFLFANIARLVTG